jgi:hypothetical protein
LAVSAQLPALSCPANPGQTHTAAALLWLCVLQLKADSDDLGQMFNNGKGWGCPFGKSLRYGAVLGLVDVSVACKHSIRASCIFGVQQECMRVVSSATAEACIRLILDARCGLHQPCGCPTGTACISSHWFKLVLCANTQGRHAGGHCYCIPKC